MSVETPWNRLSIRVVHIDLTRLATSLVPGFLGTVVLNDSGPVWPLVIGSVIGVLGALADFWRWAHTRYRVTAEQVELRTGRFARKHRAVPRDRIRSVDSSAKLRHRLFSVRVVHIGSGEAESSFTLDALTHTAAEQLQRQLMPGAAALDRAASPHSPAPPSAAEPETVIARFRWQWVGFNIVNVWTVIAAGGLLLGTYGFLRPFGVDLWAVAGRLVDWGSIGLIQTVTVGAVAASALGVTATAVVFVLEYWRFALVRVGTSPGTALLTRRGLLSTRTVHRDEQRLRGVAVAEPLIWRWWHLADTSVITTGLRGGGSDPASSVLPRVRLPEALTVANRILPDGHRPMEAPLHRHPRGALHRRLMRAVYGPVLACGVLIWYAASGAVPADVWPAPLAALPLTVALAVAAYRSLGHAVVGSYLVVRSGATNRRTVALQHGAVIGWTLRQSVLQRWGGRMTVGVATAAGDRFYQAPDAGVQQALAFLRQVTPELAAQVIEKTAAQVIGESLTAPEGDTRAGESGRRRSTVTDVRRRLEAGEPGG